MPDRILYQTAYRDRDRDGKFKVRWLPYGDSMGITRYSSYMFSQWICFIILIGEICNKIDVLYVQMNNINNIYQDLTLPQDLGVCSILSLEPNSFLTLFVEDVEDLTRRIITCILSTAVKRLMIKLCVPKAYQDVKVSKVKILPNTHQIRCWARPQMS